MQSKESGAPGAQPGGDIHQNPHDSLFRATFSQPENAVGLLRHLLPKEALAHLDFNTLELQSASYTDQHLKNLYSDLLFSEQIPASPDFEALYDISLEAFAPLREIAVRMHVLIDNLNACTTKDIQRREVLTAVCYGIYR